MSEINEELTNEIKALKQQLKLRWSVDELALANTELAFQSEKKDDLINGLVVIKKEKAKRADELALLIDTANAPIFGIDIKGLVNEWNQTSEKITGYKKEEVLGLNWLKLIPVNSQKDAKIVAENALKGIVTSNFECIIRAKNGQEVILLVNTSTRRDAAGEITGVLGVSQDITEIDKLRTASESITTELKRVIENAKQAGVIADAIQTAVNTAWLSIDFSPDGHILKANDNYVSYLGYSSSEDLVGKHHKIFCDSNYIKSSKYKSFWKNLADGKQQAGEFKRIKKDGSETWINANYTPVIDTEGKVFKIIKIASDISEMHKLRTESESIAKELRQFIETANAPIFGIDNNGLVNEWNQTSEKITGFSKEEVLGKDLVETYITEDYREAVKRVLDSALKGKETANFEFPLFTKNNQRVTILLSSSTRRSASGEITGVLGVGQDITEVKKTEQKEEERQKKSNQFSSGLVAMSNVSIKSHDNWESIITQELTSLYEFYKLDRMSIWLPDLKGFSMLTYEGEKPNPEGLDFLSFTDFPIYFENSKKSHLIISNEVENDPRLIELNEYFNITKTRSLLDASAMIGNKLIAIICFESCTPHNWTPEETYFIRSFSENITTLFLRFEDRNLRKKNELIAKELRQFIETANAPIFGIDDNGLVNEWNQTFETITGFKKVDVLGKDLVQTYITEDFREAVKQVLDNALKGKETANFEFPLFTNEGEHVMVLLNSSTRRNAAGEITGVLGVGQDITELVGHRNNLELKVDQRTLKLKQASQYSRSLIEASLDPLVTISAEGIITDVNEGSIEVTGVAREKLIGTEFSNYFTEPDLALAGYQEAFEKGSVRNYPLTIRHKKGKLTDVLYNASVYRDTDGNILGVFAAARDITAQKQASQYSRSLIEASLDPLVTISAEGIITDVNNASEKVTGATREELIGTDFSNYFTEPEKARAGYKKVFDEGSVSDYPLTIRHKKGKLTDVLYNASVYRDTDGNILGVFAAARDITQLVSSRKKLELRTKELYEALKKEKELNELKSRFVSTASHEFRTPLSAINFAAGSIKKYWSKMEPIMIEEKLDKIENQVLHMTELLDDVLLVGQAEADEIRNHPLTLNLGSFIDEIIEEVYHSSKKAQKIVLVDTESLKSTDIYIDEKLGRNIFTNLISNAVKFSPDADKVIVELSSEKDYTIISVTDFGLGIPESEIEKIFMPFTRGENVDSIQGTGLGLSIVKEALVAMGGKIIVNSTLGKGTTFMAKIPKKQI